MNQYKNKFRFSVLLITFFLATQTNQAQVRINEVLAINSSTLHDPDFGEFADFVELHNSGATPINLSGFSLTDNTADQTKWTLPALMLAPGQYLVIWTDGYDKQPGDTAFVAFKNTVATMTALHASFKLSGEGEYIGLFDPQGNLVDELKYCTQTDDVSYGRSSSTPTHWIYFGEPTPGAAIRPTDQRPWKPPANPFFP